MRAFTSQVRSVAWMMPLLTALLLSFAVPAYAAGRVEWASRTLKEREDSQSWRVEIKIFLSKAPSVAHMPMKFEFTPVVYYERSRVDGDTKEGKLIERRVPLEHRQALIESVDVGFLDPASGQTQSRTKFSFKVTRAHGFEAGEYDVKIRDANGGLVGQPVRLVFEGNNPVIDRRTMSFVKDDEGKTVKTKKQMKQVNRDGDIKDDDAPDSESGGTGTFSGVEEEEEEKPAPAAAKAGSEPATDDSAPGDENAGGPEPIREKPGGCGCRTTRPAGPGSGAFVMLVAVALLRRRERQPAAA